MTEIECDSISCKFKKEGKCSKEKIRIINLHCIDHRAEMNE
ncbi:MAG: hypothetical protein QW698_03035 [Nitrososphaerales archaeon]